MSDILIRGMEMPKSCPCELLGIGYDLCCSFTGGIPARVKEYDECCQNGTRPSWCPFVHVPPHGDLIDAQEQMRLMQSCEYDTYDDYRRAFDMLDNAPTIIQASE